MAEIAAYPSNAELHEALSYDADTGVFYWKPRGGRGYKRDGKVAGSVMASGYRTINLNHRPLLAHRIAWIMHYGDIPLDKYIDHKNGERDDNSIANLRLATRQENARNRMAPAGKLPVGVTLHRRDGLFRAAIRVELGRKKVIGYFKSADEAHSAYRQAALTHHGEFASVVRA